MPGIGRKDIRNIINDFIEDTPELTTTERQNLQRLGEVAASEWIMRMFPESDAAQKLEIIRARLERMYPGQWTEIVLAEVNQYVRTERQTA